VLSASFSTRKRDDMHGETATANAWEIAERKQEMVAGGEVQQLMTTMTTSLMVVAQHSTLILVFTQHHMCWCTHWVRYTLQIWIHYWRSHVVNCVSLE
jgi:hypothetical protein